MPLSLRLSRRVPPTVKGFARRIPAVGHLADRIYQRHGRVPFSIGPGGLLLEIDVRNPVERGLVMTEHEPYLATWLRDHVRPGWICVDVGAHIGYFTVQMARLAGPEGLVFAFEPHPNLGARLMANAELNGLTNVVWVPSAVGSEPGVGALHVEDTPAGPGGRNSLVRRTLSARTLEVPVTTLDAWLAEAKVGRVDLVKVDVEGVEPEVLAGARRLLREHRPLVVIEFNDEQTRREAERVFAECGYGTRELGRVPSCLHVVASPVLDGN